jgi:hypothetical protein
MSSSIWMRHIFWNYNNVCNIENWRLYILTHVASSARCHGSETAELLEIPAVAVSCGAKRRAVRLFWGGGGGWFGT